MPETRCEPGDCRCPSALNPATIPNPCRQGECYGCGGWSPTYAPCVCTTEDGSA